MLLTHQQSVSCRGRSWRCQNLTTGGYPCPPGWPEAHSTSPSHSFSAYHSGSTAGSSSHRHFSSSGWPSWRNIPPFPQSTPTPTPISTAPPSPPWTAPPNYDKMPKSEAWTSTNQKHNCFDLWSDFFHNQPELILCFWLSPGWVDHSMFLVLFLGSTLPLKISKVLSCRSTRPLFGMPSEIFVSCLTAASSIELQRPSALLNPPCTFFASRASPTPSARSLLLHFPVDSWW